MRASLGFIGICAIAGAAFYSAATSADSYYHRSTEGSWTNVEYNDGACHYYFSHDSYDGERHLNRYGDCSRIAIGPNGEAVPLMPAVAVSPPY